MGGEEVKGPSEKYAQLFEEGEFEKTFEHKLYRSLDHPLELSKDQIYAYNLYVERQFLTAIPYLNDLWGGSRDTLAYKYLGYSYLGIGDDQKGEEIFNFFSDYEIIH
jgi:hypothetical protein